MDQIQTAWQILEKIYTSAPLSIRFAYTYWLVLVFLYLFIGWYERMHKLAPPVRVKKKNFSYAVYLPGLITLIVYNVANSNGYPASIDFHAFRGLFAATGFALLSLGLFFATWGRLALNGRWAPELCKFDDEEEILVTNEAYRYIRHPIYSGQIYMIFGSFLVSNSWWLTLFFLAIPMDIIRAIREEKDLQDRFGSAYISYKEQTQGFIPGKPVN